MALGSPIALVGIIITAINTGKDNTLTSSTSPISPISTPKPDAKTESVIEMGINIRDEECLMTDSHKSSLEGTDYRVRKGKGTELCVDQFTADTVRSRRHLGLFQFSRPSFCAVRESVEVA
jgi:hypothetical protein